MKEANLVIGRKGKYKNLTIDESQNILKKTDDHIFERDIKYDEFGDIIKPDPEDLAHGGRTGTGLNYLMGEDDQNMRVPLGGGKFVFDAARRKFLQMMGGAAAGVGVAKTGLFGLLKAGKPGVVKSLTSVPIGSAEGMPVWYKALVNKIIKEGDDVTKKFATKEREIVHTKKLDEFEEATVYQDLDTGNVRVEYGPHVTNKEGKIIRAQNEEEVIHLEYRAGEVIEEGSKKGTKTKPEFVAAESEPQIVNWEGDIEWQGLNEVNKVDDLMRDTSKLQEYGTGKKQTIGELSKNIKKRKKFEEFSEDTRKQIDYIESKQGPIMEQIDEGVRVGDIKKGADEIKGDKIYDYTKKATGGRVPLDGGGWPGMEEYYKETVAPDIDKKISDLMKNFKHYRNRGGKKDLRDYINTWGIGGALKEGGRVPLGKGKLVTEGLPAAIAYLRKKFGQDIIKKGSQLGKSEKVVEREMFQDFNKRLKKVDKDRPATADELEEYGEILDPTGEAYIVEEGMTVRQLDDMVAEHKAYMDDMYDQYKTGKLDKYMSMEAKGKRVLDADDAGRPSGYSPDEEYEIRAAMDEADRIAAAKVNEADELAEIKKGVADVMKDTSHAGLKKSLEIDNLKLEFPGISDEMIENILTDTNPQRIAEIKATIDIYLSNFPVLY